MATIEYNCFIKPSFFFTHLYKLILLFVQKFYLIFVEAFANEKLLMKSVEYYEILSFNCMHNIVSNGCTNVMWYMYSSLLSIPPSQES